MIPFLPFIVSPILFLFIFIIGVIIARGHPGYTIAILIIEIILWVFVGAVLIFLGYKGYLGCNIITNLLGGCVC